MRILTLKLLGLLVVAMLIYWLITGMGCAVDSDVSGGDMQRLKEKRDKFCSEINDDTINRRCDRLTFASIANAGCNQMVFRLDRFLRGGAAYHRDEYQCVPDASKSECSPDGLITGLNATVRGQGWSTAQLSLIHSYLTEHDWICGEGPESLTSVRHLKGQLERVMAYGSPRTMVLGLFDETEGDDGFAVAGVPVHNQYLVSVGIDTERVLRGGRFTDVEKATLWALYQGRKNSPLFAVMAGDYKNAADLIDSYGDDPQGQSHNGWGSAPDKIVLSYTIKVMEDLND